MSLTGLFDRSAVGLRARIEASRASLFRLAYMWCHDRAVADDLTQEALARALERCGQLRDESRLRSWLCSVLANCWRDHLRARRPIDDIDAIDEARLAGDDTTHQQACASQLAARVRAAIARLPIGQRQVLSLVDLEERSYAEVAEILEIPIGTVMSRLCRGRIALRSALADVHAGATLRRVR